MTQTLDPPSTTTPAQERVDAWLADFEAALAARRRRAGRGDVRHRPLLARPGRVHLEPQDRRGPRRGRGPARRDPRAHRPERLPDRRAAGRGRRGHHGLDRVRDGGRSRARPAAAEGRGRQPGRCSPRSTSSRATRSRRAPQRPHGRRARREPEPRDLVEKREREARSSATRPSPTCSSSAAARAASRCRARLRQLGVPTIVIDKRARPGDQWRSRYKSLCLHDPVWYDHLPYIKFPENWPVFAPKDKIADWLESYTKVMELNYWSSTEAKSASYDEATGEWTVHVEREGQPLGAPAQAAGARHRHERQAQPARPTRAWTTFRGDQHHSSRTPARTRTPARRPWSSESNNSPSTSAGRCGRRAPT